MAPDHARRLRAVAAAVVELVEEGRREAALAALDELKELLLHAGWRAAHPPVLDA